MTPFVTGSSNRSVALCLLAGALLLLSWASAGFADEPAPAGAAATTPPTTSETAAAPTTEEIVAAIRKRAQKIVEERRTANRLRVYKEISQGGGYESNAANNSSHKGSYFLETSLYVALSKKLAPKIMWQGTYYGTFTNYIQFDDGDYFYQSLTPAKLIWQLSPKWRADAGVDLGHLYYPKLKVADYLEMKPFVGIQQNLWGTWFHGVHGEWLLRGYRAARATDGSARATLSHREDTQSKIRYEVGTSWKDTVVKVRQDWYLHDGNDAFQDFYDDRGYRVSVLANRPITKKLSANVTYSFEKRHYLHRTVGRISPPVHRYDDSHSWTVAGTYAIDKVWSISPSFSYRYLDSNEPTGEYFDATTAVSVTAKF